MISIELWRAAIGLFNCSRSSSLTRSASSGDSSAAGSRRLQFSTNSISCGSLLKRRALLLLLVAVIARLVLLSAGDVERNPGPISKDAQPTIKYLQYMSYTENEREVHFRLMDRIKPRVTELAIALGFPPYIIDDLKTKHDPVYEFLTQWLRGGIQDHDSRPLTWGTLITALEEAAFMEEVTVLHKMVAVASPVTGMTVPIAKDEALTLPTEEMQDSAQSVHGEKLETVNDDLEQPESIRERRGSNIQPKTALHEGKLGKNWKQLINLDRDVDSYSAFLLAKQNLISKVPRYSKNDDENDNDSCTNTLYSTLEQIEMEHKGNVTLCMNDMLTAWLLQRDNVSWIGTPSLSVLKSALEEIGEKGIDGPLMQRESMLTKALRRGVVNVKMTKLLISGAVATGKTSLTAMLLGKPPVIEHDSTVLSRPVRHARFTAENDSSLKWECFDTPAELLQLLAEGIEELAVSDRLEQSHKTLQRQSSGNNDHNNYRNLISPKSFGRSADNYNKSEIFAHLVSLLESAQKSNRLQTVHWVYTIDSGGQAAFQDILPALIRDHSLTIHTLKLNECLSDRVEMACSVNGHPICSPRDLCQTNLQLIKTLVRSSSSQCLSDGNGLPIQRPRCIIVGTFYDKVSECCETKEEKDCQLRESLQHSKDLLIETEGIIFPVNTTVEGREREEVASELREIITETEGTSIERQIPVKWFVFELELRCYVEKTGLGIISMQKCKNIGQILGMIEEEVIECIKYLHEQTLLLYFDKILPNTVFIDAQSVLDKVSAILFISFQDNKLKSSRKTIRKLPNGAHEKLQMQGRFDRELLRCLPNALQIAKGSKEPVVLFSDIFTVDDFLAILEHFLVVAKLSNGQYFIPCVLPTNPPCQQLKHTYFNKVDPLFIGWDKMPVPLGLFPALVVHLLQREAHLKLDLSKDQQLRNAIYLSCISIEGAILLVDSIDWIEVYYSGDNSKCPQIRRAILDGVFTALDTLGYQVATRHLREGFLCLADDNCKLTPHPCFVSAGDDRSKLTCSQMCYKYYPWSSQQSCWFTIMNSQDTHK